MSTSDQKISIIIEAINKTSGELNNIKNQLAGVSQTAKASGTAVSGMGTSVLGMAASFGIATTVTAAFSEVVSGLINIFKKGFTAVDEFEISVASLAAVITSFRDKSSGLNLEESYKQAYEYSKLLVEKVEEWDAKTLATGKEILVIVDTLTQAGQLIDVNNKKHEEGLIAITNAIKILTAGQSFEIQGRQEMRALLDGQAKAVSRLATLLDSQMGGALKKNVNLWKEQGTFIENVGILLDGFKIGAQNLENTWLAVNSTLQTIVNKTLRGAMRPIYEDIVKYAKDLTESMMEGDKVTEGFGSTLRESFWQIWVSIKNTVIVISNIFSGFKEPLSVVGWIVSSIFKGWGYILAILVPVSERVKDLLQAMWDIVAAVGSFGEALWKLASFDFKGAYESVQKGINRWKNAGKNTGKAFSSGFLDEVDKAIREFDKKFDDKKKGKPELPKIKAPKSEKDEKTARQEHEAARFRVESAKVLAQLESDAIAQIEADKNTKLIAIDEQYKRYKENNFISDVEREKWYSNAKLAIQKEASDKLGNLYSKVYEEVEKIRQEALIKDAEYTKQQVEQKIGFENEYLQWMRTNGLISETELINRQFDAELEKLRKEKDVIQAGFEAARDKSDYAKIAELVQQIVLWEEKWNNIIDKRPRETTTANIKDLEKELSLRMKRIDLLQREAQIKASDEFGIVNEEAMIRAEIEANNKRLNEYNKTIDLFRKKFPELAVEGNEAWESLLSSQQEFILRSKELAKEFKPFVGSDWEQALNGIKAGFREAANEIGNTFKGIKDAAKGAASDIRGEAQNFLYDWQKGNINWDKKGQLSGIQGRLDSIDKQKEYLQLQLQQINNNNTLSESQKKMQRDAIEFQMKQLDAQKQLLDAQKQAAENSKGIDEIWQGLLDRLTKRITDFMADKMINDFWDFLAGKPKSGQEGKKGEREGGIFGYIGDAWSGLLKGMKSDTQQSAAEMGETFDDGMGGIQNSITNGGSGIQGAWSGIWESIGNWTKDWLKQVGQAIADWVKLIIQWIRSAYGSAGYTGGGGDSGGGEVDPYYSHQGGYVMHKGGYALRYHPGGRIKPDEVPIIAQKGEYVLSKKDVDFVEKVKSGGPTININMSGGTTQKPTIVPMGVSVMVDNRSSAMLTASSMLRKGQDDNYIIDVVMNDINSNGRLRRGTR